MRCITVGIYDDTRVENDEFFTLSPRNGNNIRFTGGSARINILDNDGKNNNDNNKQCFRVTPLASNFY